MSTELRTRLDNGLAALGLHLDEATRAKLVVYVELLVKWNKAYNLTAIREPSEMITRHLLDSLAVMPHLYGQRIIDIGTGAGLPGIPLALAMPDRAFVLLDSNGKKTRFLVQAKAALGLANIEVVHARVEEYQPDRQFDVVITRAFASLAGILTGSRHLLAADGEFLAMKGALPQQELKALPPGFSLKEVIPLSVPGLENEQRHLLRIVAGE